MQSTITFPNRTEYFVPTVSRAYTTIQNPSLHKVKQQKMEGYETRMYYEYQDTQRKGGFTQFVTLTYNDEAIPKYNGHNCLRNSDIRYLFHDTRFFKDLKKKYGYTFKYYCGAEFGEGGETHQYKGKRGYGNNPHYHIIIFFTPLQEWKGYTDKETGEIVTTPHLTPREVADGIRHYWCGEGIYDYKEYKKGIVSFGKFDKYGLVKNFRAMSYTSKYCIKDAYFKELETQIVKETYYKLYNKARKLFDSEESIRVYVAEEQDKLIKEFRQKHGFRVLCSNHLGESALQEIKDLLNPMLKIATDKGYKMRTLPMYYFRKLFYTVEKDEYGKYFYKINELGIQYKLAHFNTEIEKKVKKTRENLNYILNNSDLLDIYIKSEDNNAIVPFVNYDREGGEHTINYTLLDGIRELINNEEEDIIYKYAIYEKVYKDRFGKFINPFGDFPMLDFNKDYKHSLKNTHRSRYHNSVTHPSIYKEDIFPYSMHPYFCQDISIYNWFNDINGYVAIQKDREQKQRYEEWKRLKNIKNKIQYAVC